jgi:phosphoglycolate phosphatase
MAKSSAILFDLDGTLVDSAPDLAATMNVLLERRGRRRLTLDDVRHMVGQGAKVLMERAMAATGEPARARDIDKMFEEFLAYYNLHIADESRVFPGVREALERLADAGCALAVCTNKPEWPSRRLLEELELDGYFGAVVGGDTLKVRKPDPEHLFECVRRLGALPGRAIMVGDSRTDVDAARAAALPVVAVTFGYTPEPVATFGPDVLIDHFDELWGALAGLGAFD